MFLLKDTTRVKGVCRIYWIDGPHGAVDGDRLSPGRFNVSITAPRRPLVTEGTPTLSLVRVVFEYGGSWLYRPYIKREVTQDTKGEVKGKFYDLE